MPETSVSQTLKNPWSSEVKSRLLSAVLLVVFTAHYATAGQNIFTDFLNRYRPSSIPGAWLAQTPAEALDLLIRDGALALTVENTIRLLLESNLNVRVDRYSPLLNQYAITSAYRIFEPRLNIDTRMSRNTRATTSQLDGSEAPSNLNHSYSVNYAQTLSTGAGILVGFRMDRLSSNNAFS